MAAKTDTGIMLLLVLLVWPVTAQHISILPNLKVLVYYSLNGSNPNVTVMGDTIKYEEGRNPDRQAMYFSGDPNAWAEIAPFSITRLSFTMACWVNTADNLGTKTILSDRYIDGQLAYIQLWFLIYTTRVGFQRQNKDNSVLTRGSNGNLLAGQWTHVAITWDQNKGIYGYFTNATLYGTKRFGPSLSWKNPTEKKIRIGDDEFFNTGPFKGKIMELYVIGQVLTAQEINRLRGHPFILSLSPNIFGKNLVLYENETLELNCTAEGDPVPEVAWYLDDTLLVRQLAQANFILKVKFGQTIVLRYEVINNVGNDTKSVIINVRRPLRLCVDYQIIDDVTRHPSAKSGLSYDHSSLDESKWYRFRNPGEALLPTRCVPQKGCSTQAPGWLNGQHPRIEAGVVQRKVCFHYKNDCCYYNTTVQIRKCYGGYYVYKFSAVPAWLPGRYCVQTDTQVEYPKEFVSFNSYKTAHALVNHVIHVETDVTDPIHCMIYCQLTRDCVSYNYNPSKQECELNKSSKTLSPADYQAKKGMIHYEKAILTRVHGSGDL